MNAGLEDVRVLFEMLDKHTNHDPNIAKAQEATPVDATTKARLRVAALAEYTTLRAPDAAAINDLALRNYEEMRSGVQSPLYKVRKWMEESVNVWLPWLGWQTQYTRVSFENQRYSEVVNDVRRQGRILMTVLTAGFVGLSGLGVLGLVGRGYGSNWFGLSGRLGRYCSHKL